jgi:uncharacterized protein
MIRRALIAGGAGSLFGAGLAVSGMVDPARVRGFLDIFGAWDPTLACVMAAALLPMAWAWVLRARRSAPLAEAAFDVPDTRPITPSLLAGASIFGIGWGLSGLCPGPAIADLALAPGPVAPFVAAMIAGFTLHRLFSPPPSRGS